MSPPLQEVTQSYHTESWKPGQRFAHRRRSPAVQRVLRGEKETAIRDNPYESLKRFNFSALPLSYPAISRGGGIRTPGLSGNDGMFVRLRRWVRVVWKRDARGRKKFALKVKNPVASSESWERLEIAPVKRQRFVRSKGWAAGSFQFTATFRSGNGYSRISSSKSISDGGSSSAIRFGSE